MLLQEGTLGVSSDILQNQIGTWNAGGNLNRFEYIYCI